MQTKLFFKSVGVAAALVVAGAGSAWAAPSGSRGAIEAQYQQERASCVSGQTGEVESACLKEAGAVRAEALRGLDQNIVGTDYRQNELERCKVFLNPADARECRMRVERGVVSGSIRDGGVIREHTTTVQTGPALVIITAPTPAPAQSDDRVAPADAPATQE